MASYRRNFIYLLFVVILVLALSACVRPLGQNETDEDAQATQEAGTASQIEEEASDVEELPAESEQATEPEVAPEEPTQEEAEAEIAEEAAESEEAESTTPDVAEDVTVTEEETPEVTEGSEAVEEAESDESMEEDEAAEEEPAVSEEAAEDVVEEAESEEPLSEEAAEESLETTLPATHTVAADENLFRIGLQYGMSWIPLAIYNGISNPNLIYTGQVLRIPGGEAPPTQLSEGATHTNYTVKPGDTLYKISRAFGVSLDEIVEANGLVNPNLIYAGQVLKIPTS